MLEEYPVEIPPQLFELQQVLFVMVLLLEYHRQIPSQLFELQVLFSIIELFVYAKSIPPDVEEALMFLTVMLEQFAIIT